MMGNCPAGLNRATNLQLCDPMLGNCAAGLNRDDEEFCVFPTHACPESRDGKAICIKRGDNNREVQFSCTMKCFTEKLAEFDATCLGDE